MGDPRRLRKKYDTPSHPWEKKRILEENRLISEFGLKNKKEIWKAKTEIARYRKLARELVGITGEERQEKESILMNKLVKMGLLEKGATIDDVLSLNRHHFFFRAAGRFTVVARSGS